jgi:hypothetical protein
MLMATEKAFIFWVEVPLEALVIRPLASTVILGLVYDPLVTAVVVSVGFGYVPAKSPPAAPFGGRLAGRLAEGTTELLFRGA